MTSSTIDEPDNPIERSATATEEELRAEIERLKKQLDKAQSPHSALEHPKRPSGGRILLLLALVGAIFLVAFFAGYIPHHRRDMQITAEASAAHETLPEVVVVAAKKASAMGELVLPGNIQAV